ASVVQAPHAKASVLLRVLAFSTGDRVGYALGFRFGCTRLGRSSVSRMLLVVGAVAALTLAACGGGGGGSNSGGGSCSPSGTTVKVVAQNFAFDKSCYAAPAGQAFTLDLDNKDSALHNFNIYTDNSATKSLFKTPTI